MPRHFDFATLDRPQQTRIRLNATAVAVQHDGAPETSESVTVTYAVNGELKKVRGQAAAVAAGGWITRHIVRDMPPAYRAAFADFHHGPMRVVNVALRNWKAFEKLGMTAAHWFDGLGFFANIRRPMTIAGARMRLFSTGYADFELEIRKQLQTLFGSTGFDAGRDIAGIVLNRWGHAYIAPKSGFYFGTPENPAPLEVIRQRYGRIAFGHGEPSGRQSWGRAAQESRRAQASLGGHRLKIAIF